MSMNAAKRVLIVDDEALVLNLIQRELEAAGMVVAGRAGDGRQAIELTQQLRPDVVLMDISMPDMDGLTAAAYIQAACPTPVVILSAHGDAEDLVRARVAGVGAFLVKPPRSADLARAILIAHARHGDLMELRRTNEKLVQAMAEISKLDGLLPICCSCKSIRDDKGYWDQVENYISKRTGAQFTHSFCPACSRRYFPELPEAELAKAEAESRRPAK
jgi:CheY-like chemotaxis protein